MACLREKTTAAGIAVILGAGIASAQPAHLRAKPAPLPAEVPAQPEPVGSSFHVPDISIHGFASEGGFVSTANDYIGASSHGSVELFEAGINFSTEIADRLRVGLQLYGRDVGAFRDLPPRLDWAYLDYHWKPWLGLRAGIIKMPYGLYNEYADIDSSRLAILMPQAVYPLQDRSALLAQTGFSLYGERAIGSAGALEYQAWLGTLDIPANALEVEGATLDKIDTKYVTGAQLFWHPPLDGLRVGGEYLRTSIDFDLTLDAANIAALIMAGVVPPSYDGKLVVSQRPDQIWIGSAEYLHDDWLFAAEYARWLKHQETTLPLVIPTFDQDSERFYAMATRRLSSHLETGGYYSVYELDVHDRLGHNAKEFAEKFYAFQRDLAATVRYDVNDHWLWKLEAHFIDGTADLISSSNPHPEHYWGLFLFKTTVTFEMMRPRIIVLIVLAVLGLATASIAGDDSFKIIVHPENPVTSVDRDFLRDAYLKKATDWNHGETIRPIDLSARFAARERFRQDVLKKTAAQLKNYWNQQIFSGKGVPPPEADSPADVIAYVLANPGGVGYLPASADPGRAKVIGIK